MEKKTVFLIGFMGTGKSAAGKRAAYSLKCPFTDTDKLVETMLAKSVPDIFQQDGEEVFRKAERRAIEDTVKNGPCLVSTGGGAACYGDNLKFMKSSGLVVTLLANPETIYKRVAASPTERPLLSCADPKSRITALLQKRAYYYINADFLVDTEDKNVAEVAAEIVRIAEHGKSRG